MFSFKSGIGEPLASSTPRHEKSTAMINDVDAHSLYAANIFDEHLMCPTVNELRISPISDTVIVQPIKRQRKKKQSRLIVDVVTTLCGEEMLTRKQQMYIECAPPKFHGLSANDAESLLSFQPFDKKSVDSMIMKQNKASENIRELFVSKPMLTIPKRSPIQSLFPKMLNTMVKEADESILADIQNVDEAHEEAYDEAYDKAHDDTQNDVMRMDEPTFEILPNPRKRSSRVMQRVTENVATLDNSSWNDERLDMIQNDTFEQPPLDRLAFIPHSDKRYHSICLLL